MKKKKPLPKPMQVFTMIAHAPQGQHVLLQMYIVYAQPSSRRKRVVSGTPPPLAGIEAASLKDAALLCIEQATACVREHLAEE
jgi:hypothetical protein